MTPSASHLMLTVFVANVANSYHTVGASHATRANLVANSTLVGLGPKLRAPHCTATEDEGANILILHPIYAGSHELILRKFGEELVSRGHRVTQVRWKSSKTQPVNSTVEVITLSVDNQDLR